MAVKAARYVWLGLPLLCMTICSIPVACKPDPKAIVARFPIGSRLRDLDQHLTKFYDSSEVVEWIPNPDAAKHTGSLRSRFGSFDAKSRGEYDRWQASPTDRDAFTGELLFFHYSAVIPDDLAPSLVFSLVYVRGVLKQVDYGHLPG